MGQGILTARPQQRSDDRIQVIACRQKRTATGFAGFLIDICSGCIESTEQFSDEFALLIVAVRNTVFTRVRAAIGHQENPQMAVSGSVDGLSLRQRTSI